jgi:O-acetylhomoserine (thiol)-lyase
VAYEFESAEEIEAAFKGELQRHQYSRISNPTVEYFEAKMKRLTGAYSVTAMASGMAVISNLIIALGKVGDNIITSKYLFGNTISLFENTLKPYHLEVKYVDLTNLEEVEEQIEKHTIAIFLETITNPQLEVADIKALSVLAKKYNLVLIADTTLTPPSVFKARDLGINFEIMSSTKYISGGATSVGGVLVDYGDFDWNCFKKTRKLAKDHGKQAFTMMFRKQVYRNLGASLSPNNAYLQSLGLDTLALRAERSTSNALKMAKWLEAHPGVTSVHHPGLESSPYHRLAVEQFGPKPCSIFTFDLESKEACYAFMNKLQLARRATNLQDNKTLIIHPYSTIFAEYTDEKKAEMGLRDTMMRLSAGIEEVQDLIDDFDQALSGK